MQGQALYDLLPGRHQWDHPECDSALVYAKAHWNASSLLRKTAK